MSRPPRSQRLKRSSGALLFGGVALVAPVAAQQPGAEIHPAVQALGSMLVTLVIGGGLVVLAPEYTHRTTDYARARPIAAFLYGLFVTVLALVALVILFVTVIGILLAIPLALVWIVMAELGFLAAGRSVSGDWGVALLGAALLSAFAGGVPVLGTVVGFVFGTVGLGAAFLEYTAKDDYRR